MALVCGHIHQRVPLGVQLLQPLYARLVHIHLRPKQPPAPSSTQAGLFSHTIPASLVLTAGEKGSKGCG
jgi:hypothetical protein